MLTIYGRQSRRCSAGMAVELGIEFDHKDFLPRSPGTSLRNSSPSPNARVPVIDDDGSSSLNRRIILFWRRSIEAALSVGRGTRRSRSNGAWGERSPRSADRKYVRHRKSTRGERKREAAKLVDGSGATARVPRRTHESEGLAGPASLSAFERRGGAFRALAGYSEVAARCGVARRCGTAACERARALRETY